MELGLMRRKWLKGIYKTEGVIVFITRKDHKKVNNKNAGDSCQKEFMYQKYEIKNSSRCHGKYVCVMQVQGADWLMLI